ncbi:MAG: hypothetical protein COX48_03685 [bacterium (Candidatus Stahlbacteria) CG23_combo_of_CG06-09_8_20_14_all_34_7]|nr:MAG: hypothetical protein COX48_03685 [bacterium (Candidatus Stahlbacteria) CG23_combo_of_CG06-09_8_20_14_all_34_7]
MYSKLKLFKAIANETRLKIVLILLQEKHCVCQLQKLLHMS